MEVIHRTGHFVLGWVEEQGSGRCIYACRLSWQKGKMYTWWVGRGKIEDGRIISGGKLKGLLRENF